MELEPILEIWSGPRLVFSAASTQVWFDSASFVFLFRTNLSLSLYDADFKEEEL